MSFLKYEILHVSYLVCALATSTCNIQSHHHCPGNDVCQSKSAQVDVCHLQPAPNKPHNPYPDMVKLFTCATSMIALLALLIHERQWHVRCEFQSLNDGNFTRLHDFVSVRGSSYVATCCCQRPSLQVALVPHAMYTENLAAFSAPAIGVVVCIQHVHRATILSCICMMYFRRLITMLTPFSSWCTWSLARNQYCTLSQACKSRIFMLACVCPADFLALCVLQNNAQCQSTILVQHALPWTDMSCTATVGFCIDGQLLMLPDMHWISRHFAVLKCDATHT